MRIVDRLSGAKQLSIFQSVKHLDSIGQFCMNLLYGDGNVGANFMDLPDMNNVKGQNIITDEFELSCYWGWGFSIKDEN